MKLYLLIFLISCPLFGESKNTSTPGACAEPVWVRDSVNPMGFMASHLKDGKLYVELPDTLLHTAMLFVRHNDGYAHDSKQIQWTKYGNEIYLEAPRIRSSAGVIIPIKGHPSSPKEMLGVFPIIETKRHPTRYTLDLTDLILSDESHWDGGSKQTLVKAMSYIKKVEVLVDEIVIQTEQVVLKDQKKLAASVNYSLFLLPAPMTPRAYDYRMGFFCEDVMSVTNHEKRSGIANVSRWRLEKKEATSPVSVPIKPICFTLSSEIPEKYKPYVKAGILEWLPAFEAAGFQDALVVNEANHDNENSMNQSMVRWGIFRNVRGFEDNKGASVSTIMDVRSGEILKSDILIGSTLQELADDYFIRCAPLDPRALRYPFPDALMGALIQYLVAHETGHALGIMDNHYGEYAYPFEKMRDVDWLQTMGHTPSIMTYARHNYLVQPEDQIPPALLIQKVGPTDLYNIRWAYSTLPKDVTPAEEAQYLENIIREQDTVAWYRYNKPHYEVIGPGSTQDVVENKDPILSSILGLKNLERVMQLLPLVNQHEKDYALLERLYEKTLDMWVNEMRHVMSLIGGYTIQYKSPAQEGARYQPIAWAEQEAALNFVLLQAFSPPDWLAQPPFLKNTHYSTQQDQLMERQITLLLELLNPKRMQRLEYMEDALSYTQASKTMLSKMQNHLFKALHQKELVIDARTQELQKAYVNYGIMGLDYALGQVSGRTDATAYSYRSVCLLRSELATLKRQIAKSLDKKRDATTLAHLKMLLKVLDPI